MDSRLQLENERRSNTKAAERLQSLRTLMLRVGEDFSSPSEKRGRNRGGVSEYLHESDPFLQQALPRGDVSAITQDDDVFRGHQSLLAEKEEEERRWSEQAMECASKLKNIDSSHADTIKNMDIRNNVCRLAFH